MIAESHISFHTFPARGFVTIDLYTCRDTIDRPRVVTLLTEAFAITSVDVFAQDRGLRYPLTDLPGPEGLADQLNLWRGRAQCAHIPARTSPAVR